MQRRGRDDTIEVAVDVEIPRPRLVEERHHSQLHQQNPILMEKYNKCIVPTKTKHKANPRSIQFEIQPGTQSATQARPVYIYPLTYGTQLSHKIHRKSSLPITPLFPDLTQQLGSSCAAGVGKVQVPDDPANPGLRNITYEEHSCGALLLYFRGRCVMLW